MIEAGRYKAKGVEGGLGMTGTGKEQVGVLLEITEGDATGEQITWYGYFTEKTVDRTMESLRHLGWAGDDLTDLTGITANEVSIVIEHEENDRGEWHARVKWINGPGGGLAMKERMDEKAARAFAARMKGAAAASRAGGQKPQTQQRQSTPRGQQPQSRGYGGGGGYTAGNQNRGDDFGGDDIPF